MWCTIQLTVSRQIATITYKIDYFPLVFILCMKLPVQLNNGNYDANRYVTFKMSINCIEINFRSFFSSSSSPPQAQNRNYTVLLRKMRSFTLLHIEKLNRIEVISNHEICSETTIFVFVCTSRTATHCRHIIGTNTTESYACSLNGAKPPQFVYCINALLCVRLFVLPIRLAFVYDALVPLYAYICLQYTRHYCIVVRCAWNTPSNASIFLNCEYRWNDDHLFMCITCVCIRWSQREFCFSSNSSGSGCGNSNDVKVHWTTVHAWLWSVRNYDIHNQRSLNFNIQQKQHECYSIWKDSLTLTHNVSDFYVNIDLCSYFDSVVQSVSAPLAMDAGGKELEARPISWITMMVTSAIWFRCYCIECIYYFASGAKKMI